MSSTKKVEPSLFLVSCVLPPLLPFFSGNSDKSAKTFPWCCVECLVGRYCEEKRRMEKTKLDS